MSKFYYYFALLLFANFGGSQQVTTENEKISKLICDGGLAELSCPPGNVISIVIGNYGRFSNSVCNDDPGFEPSPTCQNPKTKSILEKKCNGKTECEFEVTSRTFVDDISEDACPQTLKYLDFQYVCVVSATTTSSTTTTTTTTTQNSLIEEANDETTTNKDELRKEAKKKEELYCEETQQKGVKWPKTKEGRIATRECPDGSTGTQKWKCSEQGEWINEFANTSNCVSGWIDTRNSTLMSSISNGDANGIPELLRVLVSDSRRPMVGGDLPRTINILKKVIDVTGHEPWAKSVQLAANKKIIEVMNNLVRKNNEIWPSFDVSQQKMIASQLIGMVENAMATSSEYIPSTDSYVIIQPAITCEVSQKITISSHPTEYIMFPGNALWGPPNVDNANVPKEAIASVSEANTYVSFSSFDNIGAYMTPRDIVIPPKNPEEEISIRKRKVVSKIIGISLIHNGKVQPVRNLKKPVRIQFFHKESAIRHMSVATCVWWNAQQLDWSPTGCRMTKHNNTMTVCECDHLTHFAVLMDIHGHDISEANETILTILTYIGCGISIISLLITFFVYIIFSKNGGDRVFIHENLCLSLAVAEITFLAGISKTEDSIQCGMIATALLYLFLSALTWMLLEGYHIYRMLVEVFPSEPRRFIYLIIGYGVPALITIGAWLYDSNGFGSSKHCWIGTDNGLIFFFIAPASIIIVINTGVLLKTLCIVYQHSSGGYLPCRHDVDSGRSIRSWVKGSMALTCLLGVTWSFGLLWIDNDKSVFMAYIFTICNSLQGLFIFLFHVVFADKMKKDIRHWLHRHGCFSSSSSSMSSPHKRVDNQGEMMSPGVGSSTGSEFLYPGSEKYLTTLDTTSRLQYNNSRMSSNQIPHHLHQQLYEQHPGTYDYATIAYGEMMPGHMNRIAAPPAYQRLAFVNQQQAGHASSRYSSQAQLYQGWHHRPPPEFSPPPPPPAPCHISMTGGRYGTNGSMNNTTRRPPSSKMSDDSAYSDGSSSMLTTEVTPQGQTVLRIDLNKPNMYCQEL